MTIEVTCRCGAVALELEGDAVAHFYCHCDDCQAVHGAAYVPIAMYRANAVRVTRGQPSTWKLRVNTRATCPTCGTRLYAQHPDFPMRGVSGYLLPKGAFKPAFHVQCQFALLPVKDGLPHYHSVPAAFGGSDERVEW